MSSVIRYVTNTMDGGANTPNINSTGKDYQLVAFDITTTVGIAAGANANVLIWTGSGKIKSIVQVRAKVIATGELIPMGIVAQNTHTLVTLDVTGKIINVSVPGVGATIPANSVISLLLIMGNY
jgi:hypothetical protein